MNALEGYAILFAVVFGYGLAVLLLRRAGRLGPDRSLSLFGPALMLKTERGIALLGRLGRFRRFWSAAGDLGIALAATAMIVVVALL
ncbi:MAG TPA: hypothetical protein VGV64_06525, partial [Thermoplasmata archaeon]|nr:hypothetical protein [Thermoplasmata archaeon]